MRSGPVGGAVPSEKSEESLNGHIPPRVRENKEKKDGLLQMFFL